MMSILFLILPLLRLTLASNTEELPERVIYNLDEANVHFSKFIEEYNKQYDENEAKYRFEVFKNNLKRFNEWNMNSTGAVYGVTNLADLTKEEFMSLGTAMEGYEPEIKFSNVKDKNMHIYEVDSYSEYDVNPRDWRIEGVVTDVKDQGVCASSYIFSAIGVIEGQYALKYDKLVSFSEQQALDCKREFVCNSTRTTPADVLQSLKHGVMTESQYPYTQKKETCKYNKNDTVVSLRVVNEMLLGNERALALSLSANGPVAIRLRLSEEFQGYKGGISDPNDCRINPRLKTLPVHYFLLVAREGEDAATPYWVLKNSWGTKWGEKGYLRILRNKKVCSIGANVVFATVR